MAGGSDVVNVPFFGDQRKEYLLAGGVVAGGYLIWRVVKKRSSAVASAGNTGAGAAAGMGTFVGYDATGAPVYENASGQDVDANGNPDTLVTPVGTAGGGGYSNPAPITVSGPQGGGAGSAPQTDQAWTAAVEQDLTGIGYDPQAVATALAQYLASQPLTSAQVTIIRTAWAYEGRPPQHPALPIVQQPAPPAGGGGGGGTAKKLPPVGTVIQVDYLVQGSGQTWKSIGEKHGISDQHLANNNNKPVTSAPTGIIKVPVLIKPGMTADSIAHDFGISTDHLLNMVGV